MLPPTLPRPALALLLGLSLLGLACGDGAEPTGGDAPAETAEAETGDQLFDTQFGQVCRDTGQPAAAAYVPGPGLHPILFLHSTDGANYSGRTVTLPDGWRAAWPDLARTELVACVRRVSASPAQVCDGFSDDESGLSWSVQTHDVVYEYVVRVAQTAEVLDKTTFEVPAGSCPMFSSFREGDPDPKPYYPSVGNGQVELFVRPHVTGN